MTTNPLDITALKDFCFDPSSDAFQKIIDRDELDSYGMAYDLFRFAAISKYGKNWGLDDIVINDSEKAFTKRYIMTITSIDKSIKVSDINKIWFTFYATGEYRYLSKAYELCSLELAQDRYLEMKEYYKQKRDNSNSQLEIMKSFDELENYITLLNGKLSELKINSTPDQFMLPKKEKEKEEEKASGDAEEKVKNASKLFDKIAVDVFNKINTVSSGKKGNKNKK